MKNFYDTHKVIAIFMFISFILSIIVFSSIILFNLQSENKEKEYSTIVIDDQPDDIFKGIVSPEKTDNYVLDSSLGELSEINVVNGQEVNQGDTILTYTEMLDNVNIDMTSLSFAIESAKQNFDNANQDLADAKTKDSELRSEFYKVNEDERSEINSKIETNNESLKTAFRAVQSEKLALDQANANFTEAEAKVSQTSKVNVVKAKNSGIAIVSEENKDAAPLIQIVSPNTKIIAQISEFDFERIVVGQKVSVEPINSNQKYFGKVTTISSVPIAKTADSNTTYYEFMVKPDSNIQNGFNVQIHLKKNGYIIPKTAILNNQVKLEKNSEYVTTTVQTEEVNGKIIVKEGLKKGDKIAENFEDIK